MNADEDEGFLQTKTFAELGLSSKVLAAIEDAGYGSPTPIQTEAIPVALTGQDVLGIAQTGTGKTASFVLPMITRLEAGRARALGRIQLVWKLMPAAPVQLCNSSPGTIRDDFSSTFVSRRLRGGARAG